MCIRRAELGFWNRFKGRGHAHADGQEWDPIRQYRKPTARLGCPNTQRTKANKLEPSPEHSAKAVCQREIPKDYGLEPRMWGERIKEVHLKVTEFPPPPIAKQCPQDSWEVATGPSAEQEMNQYCWFIPYQDTTNTGCLSGHSIRRYMKMSVTGHSSRTEILGSKPNYHVASFLKPDMWQCGMYNLAYHNHNMYASSGIQKKRLRDGGI
ncbi:hypothetical protein BTVI_137423 [Pitangus sulphuratus]|nr:hypothetical protein BTVI_137423 [Pitangus sulphuratus]